MGCPTLYVWAHVAAAYTTIQSLGFIAVNTIFILIRAEEYTPRNGSFFDITSHYLTEIPSNNSEDCSAVGVVNPRAVSAYQFTYIVFHALWVIAGIIILSQLCRKTRASWDYLMWMLVSGIVILLDTVIGVFFIIDHTSESEDCKKAAFWMMCLSFRGFIIYLLNIACVVVVALAMRQVKKGSSTTRNNYMDPPNLKKAIQSQDKRPPAENSYSGGTQERNSKSPSQFSPGNDEIQEEDIPHTAFQSNAANNEVPQQQEGYPPQSSPLDRPLDRRNPSDQRQDDEEFRYPGDDTNNIQMPKKEQYPFSYNGAQAGRRGHEPPMSLERDEQQPFERFGEHSEWRDDFQRNQFDDGQRHMRPHPSPHGYDNPAWTDDAPFLNDDPMEEPTAPPRVHRPPPRMNRNGSNRQKRAAPQPNKAPIEERIEEEEPKPAPKLTLAAPSTFDARPFSYLNPSFRPTDHGDVKAMKSHTADIVKTLDIEMKQLKEKEMLSEVSDSDSKGIISSPPVRSFLNDSGRRQNVKRSTSLRDQLIRTNKAAAAPKRDMDALSPIEESDSRRPTTRPQRHYTDDSARPRNAPGQNAARRPRDENRGTQQQDRRQGWRDQSNISKDDDYDDYDDSECEEEEESGYHGRRHPQDPVFITAV